jgi:heptaprenyl diphosphate synthase
LKPNELAELLGIPKLPAYIKEVEYRLEAIVAANDSPLREPSLRLIRGSGKRLRPFLAIAASQSRGHAIDDAVLAGCTALELVHIGSLVHDDIIDDATTRWKTPTVNAIEGVDQAILVGDYFLALAAATAATVNVEVAHVVASTIAVMCEGQSQEMLDSYNLERSKASYLDTIRKKTAALTSASCRVGALSAGLSTQHVEALAEYGEAFGMAFQITDDLLDLLATAESIGKPVGNDIKEGVYTLPVLLALHGKYRDELSELLETNPNQAILVGLLKRSGALEATLGEIQKYNNRAVASLKKFEDNKVISGLSQLPETYLSWAMYKQSILTLK